MAAMVKWREADSSNVQWVGWLKVGNMPCVMVVFKSGHSYLYLGMHRQRAVAMLRAKSVGRYFARNVKGKYNYLRVT